MGGHDSQFQNKNDVWRSGDGVVWTLATESAAFSGRRFHQVVSYGGSLWLVGGLDRNDVWRSADGENWQLATGRAAFSGLYRHQVVVHDRGPLPFVYEVAEIAAVAPDERLVVEFG